jgi:hypothetical protein
MTIDTTLDLINFASSKLQYVEFDLGQASAIKIPDISRQAKIGIIPNQDFKQKLDEWHQRDLKREQEIKKLYKEIDKLCDGIDKPDSVIKT